MNYKFHKPITLQIYGYLAFIPFIFALFTLLESINVIDLIIYSTGLGFLIILLILNHISPILRITPKKILLYNTFSNRPITHLRENLTKIKKVNKNLIILTFSTESIEIRLNKNEANKFIKILEEHC